MGATFQVREGVIQACPLCHMTVPSLQGTQGCMGLSAASCQLCDLSEGVF